jgi:DNA-binding phage protein
MSRTNGGTSVPEMETLVSGPARRLAAFLRRRHPFKTAIAVEAEAGVCEATIKKLLTRGSMPSFATLGRLLSAYGPALLAETMDDPPEWLRAAAGEAPGP